MHPLNNKREPGQVTWPFLIPEIFARDVGYACYCYMTLYPCPWSVELERCPHFRGWYVQLDFIGVGTRRCVPIRDVSSFQRVVCTGFNGVGTRRCVPIREVSSFQRVACTGFNDVGT